MSIFAFILSTGDEGAPLILWLVAMICDTFLIATYMAARALSAC